MDCSKEGCGGEIREGVCSKCGDDTHHVRDDKDPLDEKDAHAANGSRQAVTASMRLILDSEEPTSKADLLRISEKFESLVPDDFASWRLQADLLQSAVKRLQNRQIEADETVSVMGVPLTEVTLRHACEKALRNCAHFAQSFEDRVALIDEANQVRLPTWF